MVLAQPSNIDNFAGIVKATSASGLVAMDGYRNDGNRSIPEGESAAVERFQLTRVKLSDNGPVKFPDYLTLDADGEFKKGTKENHVARAYQEGEAGSIVDAYVFGK